MAKVNWPELAFGAFLVGIGALVLVAGRDLAVGTAADMGPGWVPRTLALVIVASGVAQLGMSLIRGPHPMPAFSWRPLLAILLAGAAFAIALPTLGLVAGVIAGMMVAAAAAPPLRLTECLLVGVAIAVFSALLFVKGLGLPLKLWPW